MCIIIVAKLGHIEGKLAIDRTQKRQSNVTLRFCSSDLKKINAWAPLKAVWIGIRLESG